MEAFKKLFLKESKWSGRLARFWNLEHGWEARATLPAGHGREAHASLVFALSMVLWPLVASPQVATMSAASPSFAAVSANAGGPQLNVVNHLGDPDSALRDRKLLTYHRANDPFAVPVRGKFRGLHPVIAAAQPATLGTAVQSVVPPPTLAMAVEALPVGAVDPNSREMLVGHHLVREGDLLVIELSGYRFVVWVQSIDQRGVQICDLDLKQHALRPFRAGPKEPMGDAVVQPNNVQSFLQHHEG